MQQQSYFVQKADLSIPKDVSIVTEGLSKIFKETYENSSVEIVKCPDLREYGCSKPGIGGEDPILIDIGGVRNLMETKRHDKYVDVAKILKTLKSDCSYVFGPSAVAKCVTGLNGDLTVNFDIKEKIQKSKYYYLGIFLSFYFLILFILNKKIVILLLLIYYYFFYLENIIEFY